MEHTVYAEETEREKHLNKYQKEKEEAFSRYIKGEVVLVQKRIERLSKEYNNGDKLFETSTQYIMIERKSKPDLTITKAYYQSLKGAE